MNQSTHAVIGLWAGVAVALSDQVEPLSFALLVCSGVIGSVAPDIDSRGSVIRHAHYGLSRALARMPLQHRGWTHTALVAVLLSVLSWRVNPLYALPLIAGYWSHLALDMTTKSGVPLLRPLMSRPLHLLPKSLRVRSGGGADRFINLFLWLGFAVYAAGELARRGVL